MSVPLKSPNQHNLIFQEFPRPDPALTKAYQGIGIADVYESLGMEPFCMLPKLIAGQTPYEVWGLEQAVLASEVREIPGIYSENTILGKVKNG